MKDKLYNINLSSSIDQDVLFPIYQTRTSERDLDVISKIQKFEKTIDFFSHYTNQNVSQMCKNLSLLQTTVHLFLTKLSPSQFSPSVDLSSNDEFISIISNITILNIMSLKIKTLFDLICEKTNEYSQYFLLRKKSEIDEEFKMKIEELNNVFKNPKDDSVTPSFSRATTKQNSTVVHDEEFENIPTPKFTDFEKHEEEEDTLNFSFSDSQSTKPMKNSSLLSFSSIIESKSKEPVKEVSKSQKVFPSVFSLNLLSIPYEMYKEKYITLKQKSRFKELLIEQDTYIMTLITKTSQKSDLFTRIQQYLNNTWV